MKKVKTKKRKNKTGLKILLVVIILAAIGAGIYLNKDKIFKTKEEPSKEVPVKEEKKLQIVDEDSNTRPIAVMINNIGVARKYHSGLQDAYITYEIIVEGGITRFMAVFKDANLASIGSIRSSRAYFLDYALENDAIYIHWGGSPGALSDIKSLNIDNIDGRFYENKYFIRKKLNISREHTGFSSSQMLNEGIDKLGYRKTTSKDLLLNYTTEENDLSKIENAEVANYIEIPYSNYITTSYKYDSANKVYKRYVNGEEHTDYETKKQYTVKNIITYKVYNDAINDDDKGRQELQNIGSGQGYYISEGYAVPITWEKKSRSSQTVYKYLNGEEIKVNDGNTFIQIQPTTKTLTISE